VPVALTCSEAITLTDAVMKHMAFER
jgi:hypothetical protein